MIAPDHRPRSAAKREIVLLSLDATPLVGTRHVAAELPGGPVKLGILFVNFGYVPRDGHGGLAAHLCDAVATRGVVAYRFDLPGLGESPGPLPAHTLEFFDLVTSGGFAKITAKLVRTLCERDGLDGLVIGGLCGGAVTAIFAADMEPERVAGLLLLEPEMYLTEPKKPEAPPPPNARLRELIHKRLPSAEAYAFVNRALSTELPFRPMLQKVAAKLPLGKVFNYWGWMRFLTNEGQHGGWIPLPRKAILELILGQSTLPGVTNVKLVSAWQTIVRRKSPVLVVTAKGKLHEAFFDHINAVVLKGVDTSTVRHVRLSNTNHIFTTGGAIDAVIAEVLPFIEGRIAASQR